MGMFLKKLIEMIDVVIAYHLGDLIYQQGIILEQLACTGDTIGSQILAEGLVDTAGEDSSQVCRVYI